MYSFEMVSSLICNEYVKNIHIFLLLWKCFLTSEKQKGHRYKYISVIRFVYNRI